MTIIELKVNVYREYKFSFDSSYKLVFEIRNLHSRLSERKDEESATNACYLSPMSPRRPLYSVASREFPSLFILSLFRGEKKEKKKKLYPFLLTEYAP